MTTRFYPGNFPQIEEYQTERFNSYPVLARDYDQNGAEGAFKRFSGLPTPDEVYRFAATGLDAFVPLARIQAIFNPEAVQDALTATMVQFEQELGCVLTPTEFFKPVDYHETMSTRNMTPIQLEKWPATKIYKLSFKFSHALSSNPAAEVIVPPTWIALVKNKINVQPDQGVPVYNITSGFGAWWGPLLGNGYSSSYRPNLIEVHYVAGFENDRVPANLAYAIKQAATILLLVDVAPILFPNTSVSVSIDSVSQSASNSLYQYLMQRVQLLEQSVQKTKAALRAEHGRTIKIRMTSS